jgi:hypothetical protein
MSIGDGAWYRPVVVEGELGTRYALSDRSGSGLSFAVEWAVSVISYMEKSLCAPARSSTPRICACLYTVRSCEGVMMILFIVMMQLE